MSDKKSYYAVIPANVRYDTSLCPNAKLLYGEITALCNEQGYCWATNNYFAELYNVSKKTVSLWLKSLIDGGHIKSEIEYREGSKEIVNRYIQICKYPINKNVNTPINKNVKDNITVMNNTVNNKKIYKNSVEYSTDNIIDGYSDDEKTRELLREWVKVRKAKRSAMTGRAIQLNLDKLDTLAKESGLTVNGYLEEIIRRGWAAFYPINKQKSEYVSEYNADGLLDKIM